MPAQRAHTKGKPKHQRAGKGTHCVTGHTVYYKRVEAEKASKVGQAKRCGRCRQWRPV